ncbi:MAG: glycosyltransferase family 9 protein, partial [Candidatus Omnitrophota bacterium]
MRYVYKKKALFFLATILDLLGAVISWPFKVFNPPEVPRKLSRILLMRMDHIGDIIMATAVLKPLREAFPEAQIDLIVSSWGADLIKNNPYTSRVIEFDPVWFDRKRSAGIFSQARGVKDLARIIKEGKYDAAVDLRGDLRHILALFLSDIKCRVSYGITGGGFLLTHEVPYREGTHETEHSMDLVRVLGVSSGKPEVSISLPGEANKRSDRVLEEDDISAPYAVFHAFPGHATKLWKNENFSRVIDYVAKEKNAAAVLVGAGEDKKEASDIISMATEKAYDLTGRTDWGTLTGILKKAALFVGVDSAPAHIAAALGVPTVVVFSSVNDPRQWAPKGDKVKILCPGRGR